MRPIALYPAILTLISLNKQIDNFSLNALFFPFSNPRYSPPGRFSFF